MWHSGDSERMVSGLFYADTTTPVIFVVSLCVADENVTLSSFLFLAQRLVSFFWMMEGKMKNGFVSVCNVLFL